MGVKLGLSRLGVERKIRVLENRVLKETFGPRTDKKTGEMEKTT